MRVEWTAIAKSKCRFWPFGLAKSREINAQKISGLGSVIAIKSHAAKLQYTRKRLGV
jgi:hypothetical protein